MVNRTGSGDTSYRLKANRRLQRVRSAHDRTSNRRRKEPMADIKPFRGYRYYVGTDISAVTAPPYDVIPPQDVDVYYRREPHNIIRVILGKQYDGDAPDENRYTRARDALRKWIDEGAMRPEGAPAFYVYDETYTVDGIEYVRRGFLAALKLEPFGEGAVHPHEHTLPGPKKDRLELMRATGFNASPIFGLFGDKDGVVRENLSAVASRRGPDATAAEPDGVSHRLWAVTDEAVNERLVEALRGEAVYIADGHHRYETAVAFRDEVRATGQKLPGAEYVLMMLIPAEDPGLIVLPTHRCVYGLPEVNAQDVWAKVEKHFEVVPATREAVIGLARQPEEGPAVIGALIGGEFKILTLRDNTIMAERAPKRAASWRELDVAALHLLILEDVLGIDQEALARYTNVKYVRDAGDAIGRAETGADGVQAAFIMRPTPIQTVMQVSEDGERMPQKSTYFYPKLLSGLVLRNLADEQG
jgi:uncharacterized protein (DUF1015 family)